MQSSFAWMFGATHIDHDGMTTAVVPAGIGINDDPDGANVWSIMMKNIGIDHQLAVQGQIRPAMDEMMSKFFVRESEVASILKNHPFIPYGHEYFFCKGITSGLEGDFLVACHILIPQIENSLRYVARRQGDEPTTLHGNGAQERNGLKTLLEHPVVIETLGVNITTNLQAILVDKIYGDLRNQMSHGYVPVGQFYSTAAVFLWWLVLHILMLPYGALWEKQYGQKDTTDKNN